MFDAGAIEATMTIRLEQFDREMDRAEARVRKLESETHEVKISAVFDTASMTRARTLFADLDQQISRDAAQRLRSSPQGSVLGSLNALFSPHPVTGSPTPQQAGQQGLLGKMFTAPGAGTGGVPVPTAAPSRQQQGPQDAVPPQYQRDALGRFTASPSQTQQQQQNQQTEGLLQRLFSNIFSGRGGGGGSGGGAGGGGGGFFGNLASAAGPGILGISAKVAGGIGIGGSVIGALPALLSPLAALGVGGVGLGASGLLFQGVQKQISPLSQAFQQAQQAQAAAVTPQQAQAAAQQMQGVMQQVNQLSPALKSIFQSEQAIQNTWQSFTASFAPVFAGVLKQVASSFQSLQPTLTTFFTSATTLLQPLVQGITVFAKEALPGLGQAFRAAAPLMEPFFAGLGMLIKNLMPGLIAAFKAVEPILSVLEGILGTVGTALSQMFAAFAPVMKPAAVLLKALLDVVLSLLPIIGQLASIFATALAPAFQLFAGLLKQLEPVLVPIGKILADLAGAVLADLVSILAPLVQLIGALAPSFATLAKVLGDVFNVLENTGIFQVLADALESVVAPLAKFVNMLIDQLAPFVPPLLQILQSLINAGIQVFTTAILALIPALTQIVQALLPPLLKVLIALTPTIQQLAVLMARGLGDAIVAIVNVLTPLIVLVVKLVVNIVNWLNSTHLLLPVLLILAAYLAPIPTAIGLIGLAIGYLAEHWHRIWGDIKQWAKDAWDFIWNGFGKFLLPLLGPVGLIALGAIELYKHWSQIWGDIKQVASDFYQWIWHDFGQKIADFITKTVPSWFDTGVAAIKTAWGAVEGVFKDPVNFLINTVYDNGIARFWNDVMNAIGLGSLDLPIIKGLAAGGRVTGGTGPTADDVLIRASRGETVVSAAHSAMLAPIFASMGVPGYASGGIVGGASDIGSLVVDILTGNFGSLTSKLLGFVGLPGGTGGDIGQMITGIPKKIVSSAIHWLTGSVGGLISNLFNTGPGVTDSANAKLARQLYPLWSFGPKWAAWDYVAMRESGWSNTAMNPSSGAYGIAQALPFTKMPKAAWPASAGGMSDPATQIMWMVGYILDRYGDPTAAAAHEQQFNWYGRGLNAVFSHPTVIGVGERGPEAVSVTPLASMRHSGNVLEQLVALLNKDRPIIGEYTTAFYDTGNTDHAMRELSRTLRVGRLQAVVPGP